MTTEVAPSKAVARLVRTLDGSGDGARLVILYGNTTAIVEVFGTLRRNKRFQRHVISQAVSQGFLHKGNSSELFSEQWTRSEKKIGGGK